MASSSTGHETCFVEHERTSLTLPIAGRLDLRVAGQSMVTAPGGLVAVGPSERSSSHIVQGKTGLYSSYTIISPPRIGSTLGSDCWLHRPKLRAFLQLKRLVEFSFRLFEGAHAISAGGLAHLEALIEDAFLEALARPSDNRDAELDVHRYEWVVRTAQTYMAAHFKLPLSIPDIARSTGVGTRTLQVAFEKRRGMRPKQYLTEVRLRALREKLTCPEPLTTVTSAAMDSGIFHVGRCIGAYRERYGESPASTLRRAKLQRE